MRGPQDLRARAAAAYRRSAAAWAVDPAAAGSVRVVLGLAPPTEREALSGAQDVAAWAAAWRAWEARHDVVVERRTRSWASLGAQRVPVRAVLTGADAIAAAAGRAAVVRPHHPRAPAPHHAPARARTEDGAP